MLGTILALVTALFSDKGKTKTVPISIIETLVVGFIKLTLGFLTNCGLYAFLSCVCNRYQPTPAVDWSGRRRLLREK